MNNKEWKRWIFWFSFAVATIIVYKTIDSVSVIFSSITSFINLIKPFFFAGLLAIILYMPIKKVERSLKTRKSKYLKKYARSISIFSTYFILVLIIFIIFNFIVPVIANSVKDLFSNLPTYYNNSLNYFIDSENSIINKLNINKYAEELKETDVINNIINGIIQYINIDNLTSYISGVVSATKVIFDTFVAIIVSIYLLIERSEIKSFTINFSKAVLSEKTYNTMLKYYRKTYNIFFSYITSQLIDAFIVGIIASIAMSILRVKYAVLLGFIIGLLNIIPYFGAIIGVIIAIIITIFTGGLGQAIWMGITVTILQQLDANIINPKILGNSLNLSPILVIFAVTVGGTYFGPLGMFLGVPVIAFLKLLIEDFIESKNSVKEVNNEE